MTDAANGAALRPNTRMVFVETIANPGTQIPDLEGIIKLPAAAARCTVVDNTVASPYLFRAATVGAGRWSTRSPRALAGRAMHWAVNTDTGLYDWSGYPNIFAAYRTRATLRAGACSSSGERPARHGRARCRPTPPTSWPPARRPCRCAWTAPVPPPRRWPSGWRHTRPSRVRCCAHAARTRSTPLRASTSMAGSWLLVVRAAQPPTSAWPCKPPAVAHQGHGPADTLIIPVAHHLWEAGPEAQTMGIADSMIRLSVGLEEVEDLLADLSRRWPEPDPTWTCSP